MLPNASMNSGNSIWVKGNACGWHLNRLWWKRLRVSQDQNSRHPFAPHNYCYRLLILWLFSSAWVRFFFSLYVQLILIKNVMLWNITLHCFPLSIGLILSHNLGWVVFYFWFGFKIPNTLTYSEYVQEWSKTGETFCQRANFVFFRQDSRFPRSWVWLNTSLTDYSGICDMWSETSTTYWRWHVDDRPIPSGRITPSSSRLWLFDE